MRWAGGWPESCVLKEGFQLAAKTGYGRTVSNIQGKGIPNGRTVSNIQGKGIPNDGSSYRKTARPETCADMGDV